jgi:hypothetical protein
MIFLRTIIFITMVISAVYSASFFTDRGSVQVGGGLLFASTGYEDRDYRDNVFTFSPMVNFFPLPYFFVGPAFDMTVEGRNGSGEVGFGIGGRVGFAYGNNMAVIPFASISPQLLIGAGDNESNAGFGTDIVGGIIIPVKKHFSINMGPGFWFEVFDRRWSNTVYVWVGITGLIF